MGLVLMLTAVVFAGCGGQPTAEQAPPGETAAPETESAAKEMKEITITVTLWPTSGTTLPYHIGMAKGFFEEEGIKINGVIPGAGGGQSVRNVLSGDLPFGDVAFTSALQSYFAGAPIKLVAGMGSVNQGPSGWVTLKDSPINGIQDFPGKKIGITNPGSAGEGMLLLSLKRAGIDMSSVEIVPAGGVNEGLTLLDQGQIDAAYNPNYYTFPLEQQAKWKTVLGFSEYVSQNYSTVLVSSPQLIKEDPELVQSMVDVYNKSAEFIYENPEETAEIFAEGAEIELELAKATVDFVIENRQFEPYKILPEGINSVIESMILSGTLQESATVNWGEIIVQDFIPEENRINVSDLMLSAE